MNAIETFLSKIGTLPVPFIDNYFRLITPKLININGWVIPDYVLSTTKSDFDASTPWVFVEQFIEWYPHYSTDEIELFCQKVVDIWNCRASLEFPDCISEFLVWRQGYSESTEDEVLIIVERRK